MKEVMNAASIAPVEKSELSDAGGKIRFFSPPKKTDSARLLPIRTVRPSDQEQIAELMQESYTVWYGSDTPRQLDLDQSREFVKSFFNSMVFEEASLVSGPPGKIVSALLISRPPVERTPQIFDVFTHPLYRSRGLATSLIEECLNLLGGLSKPGLEAIVDARNERIIRILRKLGFSESPMP